MLEHKRGSGRVQDPHGAPMAGVIVNFSDPESGTLVGESVTDRDGTFVPPVSAGTYAVAAATAKGWYSSTELDVSDAPLVLRLGTDCRTYRGQVTGVSNATRRATVRFKRISAEFSEEFAVPVINRSFEICLPSGDFTVFAAGELLAVPQLVRDGSTEVSIAAVARETVLEPAPRDTGASLGIGIATLVERIPSATRIVAIGESNHGTREFLQVRGDITMQLIRTRGFRTILIEAGFGEAMAVDRYIHGQAVDVRKAVQGLGFWMWDTEEFLGVLDMLRNYNGSVAEGSRISLLGLDVQDTKANVALLLTARDVSAEERVLFEKLSADRGAAWKSFADTDRRNVLTALDRLESNRGDDALALAARGVRYRLETTTLDLTAALLHRDVGMAKMALAAADLAPDRKVIIWAHNAHVAREPVDGFPMMGRHIADAIGSAYFPIALYAAAGHARAWDERGEIGVVPHEISPIPSGLERALVNATGGRDGFLIGSEVSSDLKRWLSAPHYALEFGAAFESVGHLRSALVAYSAFGIISSASPTTPTPTGIRKAAPATP